jgi:glycosyltransferase involved in cell wall biosynthesis
MNISPSSPLPVLIFSLEAGGHYPAYLRYLLQAWQKQPDLPKAVVLISPDFADQHTALLSDYADQTQHRIKFHILPDDQYKKITIQPNLLMKTFAKWHLLSMFARQISAQHCLVMALDHFIQAPLALRWRAPCTLSGIYFRASLVNYGPQPVDLKATLHQKRHRFLLGNALSHPDIRAIFFLDKQAASYAQQHYPGGKRAFPLADPIQAVEVDHGDVQALKAACCIPSDRKILLFFGDLSLRKGLLNLLDALLALSPGEAMQICLVVAGRIHPADEHVIAPALSNFAASSPVQLETHLGYVPEGHVALYFHAADLVVAPYLNHIGMSGILLQAAAAARPVITSQYGLMGQITREFGLGAAVDVLRPELITSAIQGWLVNPASIAYDLEGMQRLVALNSVESFSETIITAIRKNLP